MNMKAFLFLVCTISMMQAQTQPEKPLAEIIFLHGNIFTGVSVDASFHGTRRASAIAIRGDRVLATGDENQILKFKGPKTQVISLDGHFVMPGFNDAHLHLAGGGFRRLTVDLTGAKSLSEFRDRLRARVATAAPGEWILGSGWDHTKWPVKELPSRWDIDEVTTDHPVFLDRVDGHIAVANTRALQLASITVASKDPQGGKIDRDSTGQPTGILREGARDAVRAVIPQATHDQHVNAVSAALADLAQSGITSAQDNSSWEDFQVYEELERAGKLTARITEWLAFDDPIETLVAHRSSHPQSDNFLHTGMLKGFMDGSLGSRTAALLAPYADDPGNSGLPQYDEAKLTQMAKERIEAGFQMGFHAIGDRGVQMALDAFSEAEKNAANKNTKAPDGGTDFRLRVEHAQVTSPAQVVRFKALKVIASMQPNHLLTDMNWAKDRLGDKRASTSYAWAAMLKNGVALAFGTDYPVEPVTPFRGLYAAVTRKSEDGKREYFPDQKLTIEQAIAAYTTGSAFAEFAEKQKGTLAPGMFADFVVLDRDLTAIPPEKILATRVLRTVVGGKIVYQAP
jgi:predicted amidohydrolase YtcJ